jgi:hypothetical protein
MKASKEKYESVDKQMGDEIEAINPPAQEIKQRRFGLMSMFFGSKTSTLVTAFSITLLVTLGVAGYFFMQVRELKQDPNKQAEKELQGVIDEVGKLMVLPVNEKPTLATVSDPSKLKDQAFFVNAELGDKVLIYANAKKAILYSVKLNKILEVAPINLGNSQQTVSTPVSTPIPLQDTKPVVAPASTRTSVRH